jgi:NAD kinase
MGAKLATDKIVIVTRKTALEELVERFNTREQAAFYIDHMGGNFEQYQSADTAYKEAVAALKDSIPRGYRAQWVDRSFLPNFTFGPFDLVVTLGPDGLVVNTAKYLNRQHLVAFNPDPERIDGVLVPFTMSQARRTLERAVSWEIDAGPDSLACREVVMARAELNDGQALLALNDLFIGQKTHTSARYRLRVKDREENQSSSGIIVSTGAGSTGWFRSIVTGASGVVQGFVDDTAVHSVREKYRFDWEATRLAFCVREPFISKTSGAELVFGWIAGKETIEIVSQMPQNGVIFSDGIEEDFLPFNSGAIAQVGLAKQRLCLLTPQVRLASGDWRVRSTPLLRVARWR